MTKRAAAAAATLLLPLWYLSEVASAFVTPSTSLIHASSPPSPLRRLTRRCAGGGSVSNADGTDPNPDRLSPAEDAALQWDLFQKHHALGSWRGTWMTYDYIGDVLDSTVASVDLHLDDGDASCTQIHKIVTGSVKADCETCFDSDDVQSSPSRSTSWAIWGGIASPASGWSSVRPSSGQGQCQPSSSSATETAASASSSSTRRCGRPVWSRDRVRRRD